MNTGIPPRAADGARLGTALTRRAVINAATQAYLRGEAVDMSALAAQLGIGRSTLYRLVGNRDDLLGVVLGEATERTFRRAAAGATAEGGVDLVLDVINRFMHAVIDAEPLQALCKREPLVFIRLALLPGAVEQIAAKLIAEMLQTESPPLWSKHRYPPPRSAKPSSECATPTSTPPCSVGPSPR